MVNIGFGGKGRPHVPYATALDIFIILCFIAVFAAIIIAQIFAPLFAALFGAKVGLLGGIFSPLGQAKFDVINAILAPFNLVLGNVGTCTAATFGGRSIDDIGVVEMIDIANNMYNGKIVV